MIGTDPHARTATTTVPVILVPLRLTFSDGTTFDGTDRVGTVSSSPLFQTAPFDTGNTQYADAMQRFSLWGKLPSGGGNYHVMLGSPTVRPTISLSVPASAGHVEGPEGIVDLSFFAGRLSTLTADASPSALLVLLLDDVAISAPGVGCCVLGLHSTVLRGGTAAPFALATYLTHDAVRVDGVEDVYALSHELVETIADPFVDNSAPSWAQPGPGGCGGRLLEVADPVELLPTSAFTVTLGPTTYHLTDVAALSWFTRRTPSQAFGGRYSYAGLLTNPSSHC
jgi:hypothetical protein